MVGVLAVVIGCGSEKTSRPGGISDAAVPSTTGDGGSTACSKTVEYIDDYQQRCQARPIARFDVADHPDCVFPLDASINPSSIREVAYDCPPRLDEADPNDAAWIISFQDRTLKMLSGCTGSPPPKVVVLYASENCVPPAP
jgi:hypothetical protein